MNEKHSEDGIEQAAPDVLVEHQERMSSVGSFIMEIKNLFPVTVLKDNFRATHRGLFVTQTFVSELLVQYQSWLSKQSGGEVHKSEVKCKKRLFGESEPVGVYLNEGRVCLSGFLVPYEMKEPQRSGLPFFLGPLSSKKEYLHPSDPVIQSLQNVEIKAIGSAVEIKVKVGGNTYLVESNIFADFKRLALSSPRIVHEFPDFEESLAVACKAVVKLLRKSKYASSSMELLVPHSFSEEKRFSFRLIGSLVFVIDKNYKICRIYDTHGKNFFYFVRQEFSALKTRNIGSFEIYNERHKMLGRFKHNGKMTEVRPQALMDFCACLQDSPDKRDHFKHLYSIKQVFERFSELYQTSQPIERHKVSGYVERFRKNIREFRINGVWIFVITRDNVIDGCVSKLSKRH